MNLDFEHRQLSVVVAEQQQQPLLITRGAPESVLSICAFYELQGEKASL